ncbi:MAG: retroviral-like aspartic protease family protein [Chloroflexota bacterium]
MNVYSFDYNSEYFPSAPTVEVEIFAPETPENTLTLTALVDSGSDGTIIPLKILKQIGAEVIDTLTVRGIHNIGVVTSTYRTSLRIGEFTINRVAVVSSTQTNEILLGRDVLNHFIVTLNGLAGVTEISQ